ncbi:uncharacterized protein LOC100881963 isoform X1 [Megachile rotundata]|uniref:uncharacterized protein LOC100881963 isoform X1 n=1 Tax=Megachile rotundata TaxID=143995 RepID=UPI003FD0D775
MGVQNSKRQETDDDIISKKSLQAVKQIIIFLKEHAREEGLFRRAGRRDLRRRILNSLKKGERPHLDNNNDAALECAAALQLFLSRLKKPVMPQHVQQLLLADNPGVTAHVIAMDALGLIRQDVGGRHGELLAGLLDLLRHLTLSGPPSERSELRGSPLPIALLPVFFTLTPADLAKWKQVAARFSELITEAPEQLQLNENRSYDVESTGVTDGSEENTAPEDLAYLANPYYASEVGEITRILAVPLHRLPAGRLHPAISNSNRLPRD